MDGEPLRILHIFRAPLGGLFRHVMDVARGQVARGHDVGIFCDSTTGGTRADDALEELRPHLSLGVTRVPIRRAIHPFDGTALLRLTRVYRDLKPNVLHGHGSKGGAFARLVVSPDLDRKAVRIYTPHGGSFNYHPGTMAHRVFMSAETILARRTDAFLFESEYVAGRFRAYVGETTKLARVVHNGISESEFEPIERAGDPFDLLYIGELRQAKGIETLVDAVALIRREHGKRLTLLVVGSGPSEASLHAYAREAGIWDSVAFVPPQPIRGALARGRLMIIPSRAESLPYVILEAAAAAQPMVSTNVGGIREIFGPFSDQLIPPDNAPLLAERILAKLAQSDVEREAEAIALSRQVHAGFSLDHMVVGVIAGYRAAFSARGIRHVQSDSSELGVKPSVNISG
jgi:glycosyltransferase involved in cell wall biosynthesis